MFRLILKMKDMEIFIENLKNKYKNYFNELKIVNNYEDKETSEYIILRLNLYLREISITNGIVNKKRIYLKMNNFVLENIDIISYFDDKWHFVYISKIIDNIQKWDYFCKLVIVYIQNIEEYIGKEKTHDILFDIQEKSNDDELVNSKYINKKINIIMNNINNLSELNYF